MHHPRRIIPFGRCGSGALTLLRSAIVVFGTSVRSLNTLRIRLRRNSTPRQLLILASMVHLSRVSPHSAMLLEFLLAWKRCGGRACRSSRTCSLVERNDRDGPLPSLAEGKSLRRVFRLCSCVGRAFRNTVLLRSDLVRREFSWIQQQEHLQCSSFQRNLPMQSLGCDRHFLRSSFEVGRILNARQMSDFGPCISSKSVQATQHLINGTTQLASLILLLIKRHSFSRVSFRNGLKEVCAASDSSICLARSHDDVSVSYLLLPSRKHFFVMIARQKS